MLLRDARTLLAADLSVSLNREPEPKERAVLEALAADDVQISPVTELMTMMGGASLNRPLAINLKAVDASTYPFYGDVELDTGRPLNDALLNDAVMVSEDLLIRLGAEVGDTVRLGTADFRIADVVRLEPDRMTGAMNFGPRAMLSREGLNRTGLTQFGSRAARRFLVKLPEEGLDIDAVRTAIETGIPSSRITDYRETSPRIRRGLDRTTSFLSLVGLLAMAVGGLGVAMIVYSHMQQRLDTIAIMKCYGATSPVIMRVFLLQTVGLGLLGSALGVTIGFLLQGLAPTFVAAYFPQAPTFDFQPLPALQASGVGLFTVLVFTIPTLLAIRRVAPALIFRREMTEQSEGKGWLRYSVSRAAMAVPMLVAIALLAMWLGDSFELGLWFSGGLAGSLLALSLCAALLLRFLRKAPIKLPFRLPVGIRHGIANLHRPGLHADVILVALGIGVTFTLTVYLLQTTVLDELALSAPPDMPNVFLSNIMDEEHEELRAFLERQPGIDGDILLLPTISARLMSVGGLPPMGEGRGGGGDRGGPDGDGARRDGRGEGRGGRGDAGRRFRRPRDITWSAVPPRGMAVEEGEWWSADSGESLVSVRDHLADFLDVEIGTTIRWQVGPDEVEARVASIHSYEGEPDWIYDFVLNEAALKDMRATYIGGIRVRPEHGSELSRRTFEAFPSVLFINAVDFFETVQEVVDQIAFVVRFVSGFAIVAGIIILVSSVTATRFRRLREVAVLKTLGATRGRLTEIFSVEFLVLGTVAGGIGSLLAVAYAMLLTRDILDLDAVVEWPAIFATVVATALLASIAGWAASFRVLSSKPQEILRAE